MLGSPAGAGGAQRGNLWPIAPASVSPANFTADGFGKYGIYSLFPGTTNFGNTLYSHNTIGRFSSGTIQSTPTTFHATHKDSIFSGYTLGAPTPPPGSPYSPVPVAQLELLTKGFNSNIIIQQPADYPLSPKKSTLPTPEKRPLVEEKCCQLKQKPCLCTTSSKTTKFVENPSGCSRTNPVDWAPVQVKKEPGTPCQVPEISTSVSPVVKVEITSPNCQIKTGEVQSTSLSSIVTTNGNIPVGIAVARQRVQQEVVSSPSLPPQGLLTTINTSTQQVKEMARLTEIDASSTSGMAASVAGGGGVPGGGTLLQCTDDRATGLATWPVGGPHGSALATPTLWQYPAPLPMEPIVPMSVPIPPVGFQLVRDPTTGGLLLLPTSAEPLQQAVVWPSYTQPSSHVLLPQLPPPPLQLFSSATSDFMQTSTTLHQHTQTHSTRLVAVTTDNKRKIPLPLPATTLIKIETDATVDHTKTLQAVSTVATNTATVFTDQSVQPVLAAHLIYQHPTNLILSQTPAPETSCRSQATSPVTCLTPPPENNQSHEQEETLVQDASNQTDTVICSEEEMEELKKQEVKEEIKTGNEEVSTSIDIKNNSSEFKNSISEVKSNLIDIKNNLLEVKSNLPEVKNNLPEVKSNLPEVKNNIPEIKNNVPEIKNNLLQIKHNFSEVKNNLSEIKNNLPEIKTVKEVEEIRVDTRTLDTSQEIFSATPKVLESTKQDETTRITSIQKDLKSSDDKTLEKDLSTPTTKIKVMNDEINKNKHTLKIPNYVAPISLPKQIKVSEPSNPLNPPNTPNQINRFQRELPKIIHSPKHNLTITECDLKPSDLRIKPSNLTDFHSRPPDIQQKPLKVQETNFKSFPLDLQIKVPNIREPEPKINEFKLNSPELKDVHPTVSDPQSKPLDFRMKPSESFTNNPEEFRPLEYSTPTKVFEEDKLKTNEICDKPDTSGLELLSSIVDIENRRNIENNNNSSDKNENKVEDKFGGLNLLCALAEQRILEEVSEQKRRQKAIEKSERKKEKRKNRNRDPDEPKHKKSKYYINEKGEKVKIKDKYKEIIVHERKNEQEQQLENPEEINNVKNCTCQDFRSYKSEEKAKKFVASKTQTLFEKGDFPCMNANELSMRMKLADLQRKYREKQQELVKLKSKKHSSHKECSKKHHRSRKKSMHSDRGTPPPPILDKIDQIKVNHRVNNGDLLKPPTLCAITDDFEKPTTHVDINENNKRCYTPDLSDSSPEKASSKKRKVGRPKKLSPSSNLSATTETLVAKKTKKCYAIGYLLAAKQRLIENNTFSDTPPRFIEESNETKKEKKHNKKSEKCKIRPKLKAEPTIKTYQEEEEDYQDEEDKEDEIEKDISKKVCDKIVNNIISTPLPCVEKETEIIKEESTQKVEETPVKEIKVEEEEEDEPIDDRCILKPDDLDKKRVLTAMGGLFYAGELKAIEPPDVYSITLDGERGNRPHIMPREDILRDAILEVHPTSEEELTVGTRVVAYWSQKYRCLYPGSVAEPDSPTSKFISVDFDDGDNGKIPLKDIRLLPPDYPFMEYDPNPLSSLSKRKRRTSTTEDSRKNSTNSTNTETTLEHYEVQESHQTDSSSHKDKKKMKKKKRDKLRRELENQEIKKKKRKHRCTEENCQHKNRKHKKHKKHKKHHHKDEKNENVIEPVKTVEPPVVTSQENWEGRSENQVENSISAESVPEDIDEEEEEEEEEDVVGNPEDEVTMEDIEDALDERQRGIRNRQASCESRSKMSAFLPDSNLWSWLGEGRTYKFRGKKKIHYKSIQRGNEVITLGDAAVFLSTGSPDRPYIGIIEKLWEICGNMKSRVRWYYHPEEATGYDIKFQIPGALLESNHQDENDVQTICRKCDVLQLDQFQKRLNHDKELYAKVYENQDLYYLAGYYDPSLVQLTVAEGTPVVKCVALKDAPPK